MEGSSRASRMKALGMPSWMARRLACDSGVCGEVVMMPATGGTSLGTAS